MSAEEERELIYYVVAIRESDKGRQPLIVQVPDRMSTADIVFSSISGRRELLDVLGSGCAFDGSEELRNLLLVTGQKELIKATHYARMRRAFEEET